MFSSGYPRSYYPYSYAPSMGRQPSSSAYEEALLRERVRALAEQRARRAQWLPDEVDNSDEDMEYSQLSPRERAYLEAHRRQQMLERLQKEREVEELARQEELSRLREEREKKWQAQLEKKQKEDEEVRRRILDQRRKEMQLRKEAAARQMAALERERSLRSQHLQKQQERTRSTSRNRGDNSIPLNLNHTTPSPSAKPRSPSPRKATPPVPQVVYTEEHENAASKIQHRYRIHRAYSTLESLASQFHSLKSEFVYPRVIDFQRPGTEEGHITVRANRPPSDFVAASQVETDTEEETPMDVDGTESKLAYSSVNYPLHTYTDAMEKLLMKLDGVESWGEKGIRERRRSIVREINDESMRLERYWRQTWRDYLDETRRQEEEERVKSMIPEDIQTGHDLDLDDSDEPVHVDLHEAEVEEDAKPDSVDDEWQHIEETPKQEAMETNEEEVSKSLVLEPEAPEEAQEIPVPVDV